MANQNTQILINMFQERYQKSPSSVGNQVELSKMWRDIFNDILPKLFETKQDFSEKLKEEFENFQQNIIPELEKVIKTKSTANGNIFEMFSAQALSSANGVTRQFNTKLGLFWEKVAALSSNVISPELHFGIKIPGVDVIVYHENKLYYTQLKTQKNTLTGSQAGRVDEELGIFDNAWFVACIKNDSSWTYYGNIKKLVGDDFWSKTTINYEELLSNLKYTINLVEELLD